MRYVTAQEGVVIPLGRQGENEVETVQFDVSGWAEEYGEGSYELLHERCLDSAPYACPITVDEDKQLVEWVVRNSDNAYKGRGRAQLVYIVDKAVAKSVIYYTSTLPAIDSDMEFPDPYEDWLVQMHEDAEYVRANIDAALDAQENSEAWAVGQRSGEDVPETDETYHNNSKYYAEYASNIISDAVDEAVAEGTAIANEAAERATANAISAEEDAAAAQNSANVAASFVGSPLTATTKAGMTDKTRVYVYVGSESGMTNGHWYYWNGTAWADGGVYNETAIDMATSADLQEALYS